MVGAVTAPSLIKFISPAMVPDEAEGIWMPVGPVADFPLGEMKKAVVEPPQEAIQHELQKKSVYVWHKESNEFVVYSRACTDLGCPVNWDPGSEWFYCPCHGGIFDKQGERRAGPPKLPLWRYQTRIKDGILEVNLRSVPPVA